MKKGGNVIGGKIVLKNNIEDFCNNNYELVIKNIIVKNSTLCVV